VELWIGSLLEEVTGSPLEGADLFRPKQAGQASPEAGEPPIVLE
jgi:hypothetical protein